MSDAAHFKHLVEGFTGAYTALIDPATYNYDNLCNFFESTDALVLVLVFCAWHVVTTSIAGPLTNDYGWVDRCWSTLPVAYGWLFAYKGDWNDRSVLMACLITIWGVRLTYNFIRKDGGQEDYRWKVLRAGMSPLVFQLFNVFFIALSQHVLILFFTLSAYVASRAADVPITCTDYWLAAGFLALVLFETIADNQQYAFQTEKYFRRDNGLPLYGDYKRGFLTTGLFRFSRHPNFFAEHTLWWVFYGFSVVASGQVLNWTALGPICLTLLINSSLDYTEAISLKKYPEYALYQKTTARWTPGPPGPSLDEP